MYFLIIWTCVAVMQDTSHSQPHCKMDWRPVAEFKGASKPGSETNRLQALQLCEGAAREMGKDPKTFKCVRTQE